MIYIISIIKITTLLFDKIRKFNSIKFIIILMLIYTLNQIIINKFKIRLNNKNIKHSKEIKKVINESNNIYKKYHFDSLKVSMDKAQNFLYNNIRGIITNDKRKFKYDLFPKVSVIIPVYNSQYFIQRTIKSIQNQNILNIEIILINDCSTDKTLSLIENEKIQDSRIKI